MFCENFQPSFAFIALWSLTALHCLLSLYESIPSFTTKGPKTIKICIQPSLRKYLYIEQEKPRSNDNSCIRSFVSWPQFQSELLSDTSLVNFQRSRVLNLPCVWLFASSRRCASICCPTREFLHREVTELAHCEANWHINKAARSPGPSRSGRAAAITKLYPPFYCPNYTPTPPIYSPSLTSILKILWCGLYRGGVRDKYRYQTMWTETLHYYCKMYIPNGKMA